MKSRFTLFLTICLSLMFQHAAQAQDYAEYARQVRESVWKWDKPEFSAREIPAKYNNESAVVIAYHNDIQVNDKKKIRFDVNTLISLNKELYYTYVTRMMIKIQDDNALDAYSEINFREQRKTAGYRISNKMKTIVGARIIKPNGEIKEVNVDEAVDITEGKKDKVEHKKLAISGLQKGDILDYFIQDEMHMDDENIPTLNFAFLHQYPMLSYSVHCEIGKNLTTEYRSVNGAPEFTVSENEDNYVLDAQQKDIKKAGNYIWTEPFRQYPIIRLSILYNSSGNIYKPATARKKGLYKDPDPNVLLTDAFLAITDAGKMTSSLSADMAKDIKRFKKSNPNADKKEFADFIYNSLKFHLPTAYYRSSYYTMYLLNYFLNAQKIESSIGLATPRNAPRTADAVSFLDFEPIVTANDNSQIYTYPSFFSVAGEYDYRYEGEEAALAGTGKVKRKLPDTSSGENPYGNFTIPVTSPQQNLSTIKTSADFSADDPSCLIINREMNIRRNAKTPFQYLILLFEDADNEKRKELGITESLIEESEKSRGTRKYVEGYKAQFEKERKAQIDSLKREVFLYHDVNPKEVLNFAIKSSGVTQKENELIYSVKYSMEGLVKRAGANMILDAGKLLGSQVKPDDEDINRDKDVYMPYQRAYENEIRISIPQGYAIDRIDNLNKKAENDCGRFVSEASIDGSTLIIKTWKVYEHNYEPLSNWKKILQIIDAANDFYGQSVVLKKL